MEVTLLIYILIIKLSFVSCQNYNQCDYYQYLELSEVYIISSAGNLSPRNTSCRFAAEAPYGYKIHASCRFSFLFPIPKCQNTLKISPRGRVDFADAILYCGWFGYFSTKSLSNRMTIQFLTGNSPFRSRFRCSLTLIADTCECGRRNTGKIVGGNETLINEFPLMGAIVHDSSDVWCGATIISEKTAISAAHCFYGRNYTDMKLVVGEHNISTTTETRFTRSYDIGNVTIHENYNEAVISENDIALIFTKTVISFDHGVSPSCLPFRFENSTFADEKVLGIGWGTTEFAGPKSDVLRKVEMVVIDEFVCSENLLCATATGRDLCQFDSGGPILYQWSNNSLLYNIGITSSGDGCGTSLFNMNVRVTEYLEWILKKTMPTVYCAK